jgi:hypothetical protein
MTKFLLQGKVVPFLGAGVNLCDRPPGSRYAESSAAWLPSGAELAQALAAEFNYPLRGCSVTECPQNTPDLLRVSQYVQTTLETGPLHEKLHEVFSRAAGSTTVHRFLAELPGAIREARRQAPGREILFPLIVTTNYDALIENAFESAGEEYDLVFYQPSGPADMAPGRFWHRAPGSGSPVSIDSANSYPVLFGQDRSTILKVHGTIEPRDPRTEGFVITEDDYIEFLVRQPLETLLPQELLARLRSSHILFLGYSLRDWNFRVFLRRLWSQKTQRRKAWAVMRFSNPVEQQLEEAFWRGNGVDIWPMPLNDYIAVLRTQLGQAGR